MDSGIESFIWHRAEGGYEWQDGHSAKSEGQPEADERETRFLVPRPMEKARHWRYEPLTEYPTLFREFAELEPNEAAYAGFAGKYGDLGVGLLLARQGPLTFADPYHRWRSEHIKMRVLVDVLAAIQAGNADALRQWFVVGNNGARYERQDEFVGHRAGWFTIANQLRPHIWDWATSAESDDEALIRFAKGWAQREINDVISEKAERNALTHARILFNSDQGRMMLRVVPDTLLGAMWLQCARVLTVNPTFRECGHCGKWFELSPDTRRKQSKYCSDRCKVAAYRRRKAAIIPMDCSHCHKQFVVACEVTSGFGYMNFYRIECPHCHKATERQLPNDIIEVRAATVA